MVVPADAGGQSPSASLVSPADPQGDPLAVLPPQYPEGDVTRDGCGTDYCESVGGFVSQYTFPDRFRGNKFSFEYAGDLLEFSMELCIHTEMDLWFSVFEYDEDNRRFCRVRINKDPDTNGDVVVENAGPGCAFYSTGSLTGVELAAGSTYVLGVAWGGPSITYAWDLLSNPRDFSHGQILGAVSLSTPVGGPPVDPEDECPTLGHSPVGLWSMEVCLGLDPGACCLDDATCEYLNLFECLVAGGVFAAPLLTCTDVEGCPMVQGACCFGDGCKPHNQYRCECEGGDSWVEGALCWDDPDPCGEYGACCISGGCEQRTEGECLAGEGSFRGVGTECGSETPPCFLGACCAGQVCWLDTEQNCLEWDSWFAGLGTTCDDNPDPCIPLGACCVNWVCHDGLTEDECAGQGGVYRGDLTACDSIPVVCTAGACCTESACFVAGSYEACLDEGGSFVGTGTDCTDDPCEPRGACCADDECLGERTADECTDATGVYRGDWTACITLSPGCGLGACCVPNVGCISDLSEVVCQGSPGTVFQGEGTDCGSLEKGCLGDCCADFGCLEGLPPEHCTDWPGGVFLEYGQSCNADPPDVSCDEVSGSACCLLSGACVMVSSEGACVSLNENWNWKPGVDCAEFSCPHPDAVGACCLPGEECAEVTSSACASAGGIYHGDETSCAAGLCLVVGACCLDDVCAVVSEPVCVTSGGVYHGDGVLCDPDPCGKPSGACCIGQTCTIQTAQDCTGAGGVYHGDGVLCDPDPCGEPSGACCIDETCTIQAAQDCIGAGGSYQGDDIPCDPNPCEAISIIGSNPPADAIDARKPSDINDCGIEFGWDSIDITFDGAASGVGVSDFWVNLDPPGVPPTILALTHPSGDIVTVQLDGAIPTGHWTIFTHIASDTSTRIGYLPADVNGDGTSGPVDVLDMIDSLNEVPGVEFPEWSTDCDRSGATNPADILTVIDLLNGAGCFAPWNGETLPQ